MRRSTLSLLGLGLFLPTIASAIGLTVTPDRLSFRTTPGIPATKTVTITNPSPRVAFFESYPDELEDLITVTPESWTLESGATRTITITVEPKKSGRSETTLSIVARPIEDAATLPGSGVKLPLSITAEETGVPTVDHSRLVLWSIFLLSLIGAGLLLHPRRRSI